MSENIEFISAANLPEAEGDEVNVLCVENGELKQKAASGLGSTVYDIVVRFRPSYDESEDYVTVTAEIISGSYNAVMQKLDAGIMPLALVIEDGTIWGNRQIKVVGEVCPFWQFRQEYGEHLTFDGMDMSYGLLPSGSVITDL